MQKVLVAVDLSDETQPLTEVAGGLARFGGCSLTLLYVSPIDPKLATSNPVEDPAGFVDGEPVRVALGRLESLADSLRSDDLQVSTQLVDGDPAEQILKTAEAESYELVVLGAHRHGVVERILLGSVSEAVLREAPCPVLVIPSRLLTSD